MIKYTWWGALRSNVWEAVIALAAVIAGVFFWLDPPSVTSPALNAALGPWDNVWYALYCLGGAMVLAGLLLHGRPVRFGRFQLAGDGRMEFAGLCLFFSALVVNAAAITAFGFIGTPSMVLYVGLACACLVRCRDLLKARKMSIEHGDEG